MVLSYIILSVVCRDFKIPNIYYEYSFLLSYLTLFCCLHFLILLIFISLLCVYIKKNIAVNKSITSKYYCNDNIYIFQNYQITMKDIIFVQLIKNIAHWNFHVTVLMCFHSYYRIIYHVIVLFLHVHHCLILPCFYILYSLCFVCSFSYMYVY